MRQPLKLDVPTPHTNSCSAPSSEEAVRIFTTRMASFIFKKKSEAYIAKHLIYLGSAFAACYNFSELKNFIIIEKM